MSDIYLEAKDHGFIAESNDFIAICGPNGSGKSALLKALAGVMPYEGEILLNGKDLNSYERKELSEKISYMQQDLPVSLSYSAENIVAKGGKDIDKSMDLAGCYEYKDKCMTELSAGQRQRVMLAKALAADTPLMILDDPLSFQDIRSREETMDLLRTLADKGKSIIIATHDLKMAAKYCTRTALMHEGKLVASGDPEEVFHYGHLEYVYLIRSHTYKDPEGSWDYYTEI